MTRKFKPTQEQKEKAEARRNALKEIWGKVAELSQEQRAAMAEKMVLANTCEGHTLSANNTIFLAYQRENVTIVGGYNQWKQYDRQVRKGESALAIWAPTTRAKKDDAGTAAPSMMTDATNEPKKDRPDYYIFVNVFDISQTDPIEAPAA